MANTTIYTSTIKGIQKLIANIRIESRGLSNKEMDDLIAIHEKLRGLECHLHDLEGPILNPS